VKECESNALENPHYQKRPKRGSYKIGKGSEGKKEGTGDHKFFLRGF
jgi:hypothetical protein